MMRLKPKGKNTCLRSPVKALGKVTTDHVVAVTEQHAAKRLSLSSRYSFTVYLPLQRGH